MEGVNSMAEMATTIEPVMTALTGSITPGQIVAVLASIIGVGMTLERKSYQLQLLLYLLQ